MYLRRNGLVFGDFVRSVAASVAHNIYRDPANGRAFQEGTFIHFDRFM